MVDVLEEKMSDKWDWCKFMKCESFNDSLKNKCTNKYGLTPFDCEDGADIEESLKFGEFLRRNDE